MQISTNIMRRYAECHYADCHYAECRGTIHHDHQNIVAFVLLNPGTSYKDIAGTNLQMFVIRQSVFPRQAFPAWSNFVAMAKSKS